jgi:hypothetical protein
VCRDSCVQTAWPDGGERQERAGGSSRNIWHTARSATCALAGRCLHGAPLCGLQRVDDRCFAAAARTCAPGGGRGCARRPPLRVSACWSRTQVSAEGHAVQHRPPSFTAVQGAARLSCRLRGSHGVPQRGLSQEVPSVSEHTLLYGNALAPAPFRKPSGTHSSVWRP